MEFHLTGKVALITGASRGIGRAIAERFAEEGAEVVVVYREREADADVVIAQIITAGGRGQAVRADVSVESEVEGLFKVLQKEYGRLDILVNNAGILENHLLLMTPTMEFDTMFAANCRGTFLCSRAALKMMAEQKFGKIINMSSVAGVYGNRGQSVYAASKAAILGFTKSVAKEAGALGVTVNALAPGFITTDLTEAMPQKIRDSITSTIALGRVGTTREVANAALFLASPLADYISGQILGVDGCQIL